MMELSGVAHDWLIEALIDLRTYAQVHDLPALSEQLDLTLQVAQLETAQDQPCSPDDQYDYQQTE
ncbi:MAG: hypothetical protein EA339_15595 [Rhodobacteraceae bacterium]|nr:MAG: hypothetical protein EA339_15595 [Paracoccaceae bacterium]